MNEEDPLDKLRREHAISKQNAQDEMATLCAEFESLLAHPPDADILEKQALALDSILRAVMRRNLLRDKTNGYFDTNHLALALRIQKQCMDTIKTRAAIEYMKNITAQPPSPHPPLITEQTGETKNA